jgi:WXXGXW repeat (2 copies)
MRNHWLRGLIPALSLAALPVLPTVSHAGIAVGVSINVAPPVLPVYVQPPLPGPGYMWTPGYWAYGDDGYYWVPGTWVLPPTPGLLWTPGYWGWAGGVYAWHGGYWGPHIGFYGGVNYGFGYGGVGFEGGYWRGGAFFYNRAAVNVGGVHITNVYNRTIINNNVHVAFNGPGGIQARATAHELAAERDHHFEATALQRDHEHAAAGNRELRASFNHGRPGIAATARPGEFSGRGVVGAHGSGPHGGPVGHEVAHNGGPAGHGPENHGGPGAAGHGGPGGENHGAPGGGHPPVARNDGHEGHPGSPGGGAPHGNPGGGAPHPGGNVGGGHPNAGGGGHPNPGGGGHPNPGGGGHPQMAGGGHPGGGGGHPNPGGGHPNPGGGAHKPEGHR